MVKLMPYQYARQAQRQLLQQQQNVHAPAPMRCPYPPRPSGVQHSTRQIGAYYETLAARFLRTQQHDILARQLHYPQGEIDVLAFSAPFLVVVEVRYRQRADYGGVHYSLSPAKTRRLQRLAQRAWQDYAPLLTVEGCGDLWLRIDVILFDRQHLHWLPGAIAYE